MPVTTMKPALGAITLAMGLALPAIAQDAGTVVATVNGTEITLGHVIVMRQSLPEQYQSLEDDVLFNGILDQLVQQTALAAQSDALSRRGEIAIENERRTMVAAEVVQRFAEAAVTDEKVQSLYDETYANAAPEMQYNASHILVESEEVAQSLLAEAEGGADFAELAREHSTGPSGPNGGELGWFQPEAMVEPFSAAVQEMEVGAIGGPVETQFGWHVIKLNDVRELDTPPLEEVRGELVGMIQEEAVEGLVESAMGEAQVERATGIDPALLRQDDLLAD